VTPVEENRENRMETHHADKKKRQPKASAYVCPQCGFAIDLNLPNGIIHNTTITVIVQ
jgi:rubrerythrin